MTRPIVLMSMGCVERMHTMRWLDGMGLPYHVFTHYEENAQRIRTAAPHATVHVTGLHNLVDMRNAALDLVPEDEWFIGMDDNIQRIDRVRGDYYNEMEVDTVNSAPKGAASWRDVYRTDATEEMLGLCEELIMACIKRGTIYGGFASMENPFFRTRKWSSVRFVKSKLFVMRRVAGLQWGGGNYAHDSWMSAYTVAKYGSIAVNNFVHPVHKMYEQGGLGHGRDRRPHLDPALDKIVAQFGGLVAKGKGENTALRFLRTTTASVRQWQNDNPLWEMWNDS